MTTDGLTDLLLQKRVELDRWFAMIKADYEQQMHAINTLLEAEGVSPPHRTPSSSNRYTMTTGAELDEQATTRDFVKRALLNAGGPIKMVDVVSAVEEMGSTASPDTVRGVLQKMLHAGEATRPVRGLYALAFNSGPNRTIDDELDLSLGLMEVEPSP